MVSTAPRTPFLSMTHEINPDADCTVTGYTTEVGASTTCAATGTGCASGYCMQSLRDESGYARLVFGETLSTVEIHATFYVAPSGACGTTTRRLLMVRSASATEVGLYLSDSSGLKLSVYTVDDNTFTPGTTAMSCDQLYYVRMRVTKDSTNADDAGAGTDGAVHVWLSTDGNSWSKEHTLTTLDTSNSSNNYNRADFGSSTSGLSGDTTSIDNIYYYY